MKLYIHRNKIRVIHQQQIQKVGSWIGLIFLITDPHILSMSKLISDPNIGSEHPYNKWHTFSYCKNVL